MAEQMRVVIEERPRQLLPSQQGPEQRIFHLPDGPSVNEFQPVKCGGGILLHGPRVKTPRSLICPDCTEGRKTL